MTTGGELRAIPFERASTARAENYHCRLKAVDLLGVSDTSDARRCWDVHTASVIKRLALLQWMTSTAIRTWSFVFLTSLIQRCDISSIAWYLSASALGIFRESTEPPLLSVPGSNEPAESGDGVVLELAF